MFSTKKYSPITLTKILDEKSSNQNRQQQLSSLVSGVKTARDGDISAGISPSEENDILKRFKSHGYQDGLEKRSMNQQVLDTFSLTPDYRYADAYGKAYKEGKEKAIRSTNYGGKKTRKHRKGSKKTMKKKSRKHRK